MLIIKEKDIKYFGIHGLEHIFNYSNHDDPIVKIINKHFPDLMNNLILTR